MDKLFQIYKKLLDTHIQSKTTGTQYHKDLETAYNVAFDVFHTVSEMSQDLGYGTTTNCEESGKDVFKIIGEMKSIIDKMITKNKDTGMDDLLRGHSQSLTNLYGTFRQYTKE